MIIPIPLDFNDDGMEACIYKFDVVDEKDEESSEIDLFVQPWKAVNDDPISSKPISESKRIKTSVEWLNYSDNNVKTPSETGWSEHSLLLPVIGLVSISAVIIILGTVRTVLNKNSDSSRYQLRVYISQGSVLISPRQA